jgi:hypothetical protein
MDRILMAPPALMGKWKGVSNGQRGNVDQIKGQKVSQTNKGFPYNSFGVDFMSKIMTQSNEQNGGGVDHTERCQKQSLHRVMPNALMPL